MASARGLRRLTHRLLDVGRTIGFVQLARTVPRWLVRREFLQRVVRRLYGRGFQAP